MLLHNNVVRLFDSKYIEKTKEFYLVTEYITGGNAEDLVLKKYKGPAPINEACDVICQILYGLEYTHSSTKEKPSIVHRDITPRNILLSNNNNSTNNNNYHFVAKLADYGLAKPLEDIGSFSLTRKNEYAGTHLYMSLEQIKNYKYVKPSTDIYSVGITLYYLLTSKYPFNYPSQLELKHDAKVYQEYRQGRYHGKILKHPVMMVIEDPRIPIRKVNSSIPDPLANMIDTAIQKDEKNRSAFTTAKALREAIQGCMNC
jgi:serine/threonine protein kinase